MMDINDILKKKNMTKYRLSKVSGAPFTTISEITTGKTKIKNCTGDTLYRLARALDVTIEDMLADCAWQDDFTGVRKGLFSDTRKGEFSGIRGIVSYAGSFFHAPYEGSPHSIANCSINELFSSAMEQFVFSAKNYDPSFE